ncbi:unnamed protein product [Lactuca virosa]|uniref:Uncharacterized protein n=1 Tax=Lactuca virosa TaxID=75947 RepID=A0AAU9MZZ2_9ASTR|nr:unnamed protein product [Lactuca virosa]
MKILFENLECYSVRRIPHVLFVVGEESSRAGLKVEIVVGTYDPGASDSRSNYTTDMNPTIDDFVMLDYVSMLGIGCLDIEGLKHMCTFDDEDIAVAPGGDGGAGGAVVSGGQGLDGVGPRNVQVG